MSLKVARNVGFAALTLAYPLIVYWGLGRWEPRYLAGFLALLALLRAAVKREPVWLVGAAGALLLAAISAVGNHALPLKLYPVLISLVMLAVFGASLRYPPTVIERFARIAEPNLNPAGVAYTRRVTQLWCGFFVTNGAISAATACWGSDQVWALYNGLLSYLIMGALFVGEWLVRQRVKARHANA